MIFLLTLVSLIIDLLVWSILGAPCTTFSRVAFYTVVSRKAAFFDIFISILLALVPLFMITGWYGTDLLLFVPLGFFLYWLCSITALSGFSLALCISALLCTHYFFDWMLVGFSSSAQAIFVAFISSLAMVYFTQGSQGNRSLL